MKEADIPKNEEQRLERLQQTLLLDSAPDAQVDALVSDVAHHFGVDKALFSLVDAERQWFKSRHRLDVAQTPRNVSFCAHAILQPAVMVVNDASQDDRFADNPLVVGPPYIRFYAGAPVEFLDGSALGTLCLLHSEPRQFSPDDKLKLEEFRAKLTSLVLHGMSDN